MSNLEIRPVKDTDVHNIASIDLKCQENPLDVEVIIELLKNQDVFGVLSTLDSRPAAFALFNIQDNGDVVFLNRLSVIPNLIESGSFEHLIKTLRVTNSNTPAATLRAVISESEIQTQVFKKMVSYGFKSTGMIPNHFYEYSQTFGHAVDRPGIKMELS